MKYIMWLFMALAGLSLAMMINVGVDYQPPTELTTATPGVGYYTVTWPDGARNARPVELVLFYGVNDTTGLAQANYQITDGNGTVFGQHPMDGVKAGGLNRIQGQHPLIVFSHGAGAIGIGYYELARELAKRGYIIIFPTHRGDSLYEVGLGIPADPWATIIFNRNLDMKLATTVGEALISPHHDGNVVAAGQSMGGVTALTMATGLNPLIMPDGRITAAIAINPAGYLLQLSGTTTLDILQSLEKPTMLIGARNDLVVPPSVVDSVAVQLTNTPFTDRIDIDNADHTASSSVWPLKASLDASTAPQAVKDHVVGTAEGACPDHTDSCVANEHELQLDAILDFLERALP